MGALDSLLAKKSIPAVGPGVPVCIKDSPQPGLEGKIAMCMSAENSEGKCEVSLGRGNRLWISRTGLLTREEEIQRRRKKREEEEANRNSCNGGGGAQPCSSKRSCDDGREKA